MGRRKRVIKIKKIIIAVGNEQEIIGLNSKEDFINSKEETSKQILKMRNKILEFKQQFFEIQKQVCQHMMIQGGETETSNGNLISPNQKKEKKQNVEYSMDNDPTHDECQENDDFLVNYFL